MLEPDVTITDYILAIQCLFFGIIIWKDNNNLKNKYWAALFASLSAASLIGGTVHGFFPDVTMFGKVLWVATLISIGLTAFLLWRISSFYLLKANAVRVVKIISYTQLAAYIFIAIFITQKFYIAAIAYSLSAIFLLFILLLQYYQNKQNYFLIGALSIVITFVGSYVQIAHISLNEHINHNGFYHIIQFIALCLLFVFCRKDLKKNKYER